MTLDGSGSSDPNSTPGTNDDIVLFEWFEDFGLGSQTFLGTGETLQVVLPLGDHTITLRVTDSFGETDTDGVVHTVADTTPPVITVAPSPSSLWPPNHKMVDVSVTVVATEVCGTPSVVLTSATSNEPDNATGNGDGDTVNDIQDADLGTADFDSRLRAERAGSGDGRTYTVVYTATDGSGNQTTASSTVTVDHSQGGVTEPLELSLEKSAGGTLVTWTSEIVAEQLSYNVIRGTLDGLDDGGSAYDLGAVTCIESASANNNTEGYEDAAVPASGEVFIYLVEYNDGLRSSYGTVSAGKPRVPAVGDCE